MIILLIWVAVLIAVLVLYLRQIYSKFHRYGVKHFRPVPLLGNMARVLFRYNHFIDDVLDLYRSFPEERFVGRFEFINELVVVRDIELVKKITVKDFEHFLDHRSIFSTSDSFFSRNLFSLKGQEWKDMRSTLSPAFTSSKIRVMVPFMVEVGDQMMSSLSKKIKESKSGYIDIECKDLTTRYANDVIASCAFGLKVDSHNDVDNEFYAMGKLSSTFKFRQMLMFFIISNAPKLAKVLKLDFLSNMSKQFFRKLVMETMENRELKNIIRPDMIHLLMEAKKGKLTHDDSKTNDEAAGFATVEESSIGQKEINRVWTDDDLIAQAVLFFIAGFETVSSGMSFLLYELALNPDVQDRLAKEIKENDVKNGGKFDFNSIQNMQYLDMVVSELLRMWPPGIALDRICTKDYNLGKPNDKAEKDFIVRKGTGLWIPTIGFHRDPQFFPNPDKFDPERFSEENKHNISSFAYMPFGVGPRNCIGSRFALCEMKVMAYQILLHMEVSPCERTTIPAKLDKETFNIRLEGGHWLRFRPRK
nr:cytochrome P450 [Athetis lepigone]